jgi:GTP-binding protein EngB required for normal cell division
MPDTPIASFIHLVQDTVAFLKRQPKPCLASVAEDLEMFSKSRLMPIWHREQTSLHAPYVLSFVGLTNVGKSTLMEALLGFPIAPRKTGPATAIPVEYRHDKAWKVTVQYRASVRRPETLLFDDASALGVELRSRVVDVSANEAADVAWVTVRGPINMLVHGLSMADTPGFGAAQTGDDDGSHQRRLEEFVAFRVHRVYFCVAAGTAWAVSDVERDFYQRIAHLCGHVVVTKWEGSHEAQKEYQKRYQPLFPGADFIFVNARRAMRGVGESFDLDRLREIIHSYSTPERRQAMCDPEVAAAWRDITEHVARVRCLDAIPWRPDSLRQFAEACGRRPGVGQLLADVCSTAGRGEA